MLAGLLSTCVDPTVPPLLGGRITLTVVAILVTMNGLSRPKPGLAGVNDMLFVDIIAMVRDAFEAYIRAIGDTT